VHLKPRKPGQSGNPRGRPPLPEIIKLARQRTPAALQTLEDVMIKAKNPRARVAAASVLLAYGWGKHPLAVALDVHGEGLIPVSQWRTEMERAEESFTRKLGLDGHTPGTRPAPGRVWGPEDGRPLA
jgi:hypothetical protein